MFPLTALRRMGLFASAKLHQRAHEPNQTCRQQDVLKRGERGAGSLIAGKDHESDHHDSNDANGRGFTCTCHSAFPLYEGTTAPTVSTVKQTAISSSMLAVPTPCTDPGLRAQLNPIGQAAFSASQPYTLMVTVPPYGNDWPASVVPLRWTQWTPAPFLNTRCRSGDARHKNEVREAAT